MISQKANKYFFNTLTSIFSALEVFWHPKQSLHGEERAALMVCRKRAFDLLMVKFRQCLTLMGPLIGYLVEAPINKGGFCIY